MSLCVGDRVVCRSVPSCIPDGHLRRVTHTLDVLLIKFDSLDDEHEVAENM
jgi:hypothetical protein